MSKSAPDQFSQKLIDCQINNYTDRDRDDKFKLKQLYNEEGGNIPNEPTSCFRFLPTKLSHTKGRRCKEEKKATQKSIPRMRLRFEQQQKEKTIKNIKFTSRLFDFKFITGPQETDSMNCDFHSQQLSRLHLMEPYSQELQLQCLAVAPVLSFWFLVDDS